jgi:transposase-like protein
MDKLELKARVIKEYLAGKTSTRKLARNHDCSYTTVWRWVMEEKKEKTKLELLQAAKLAVKEKMPTDVKQLQKALRDSELKVCLLEAMIDISDEKFGTNIRKKAGTRPS